MAAFVSIVVALIGRFYPAIAPAFYLLYVLASHQDPSAAIAALLAALGISHQVAAVPKQVASYQDRAP